MPSANTGQNAAQSAITVGTSATALVNGRLARRAVVIQNLDAAAIFIGGSNVAASGANAGISIPANASMTFETLDGPLWAISAAGTAANAVHILEIHG